MNEMENKAAIDVSRATLYQFLSALYLQEVNQEILREIQKSGLPKIAEEAGISFHEMEDDASELYAVLEAEYARLFIGPGPHIPPYWFSLQGRR